MTVFKTFLKVLNKCKGTIIMYTKMGLHSRNKCSRI